MYTVERCQSSFKSKLLTLLRDRGQDRELHSIALDIISGVLGLYIRRDRERDVRRHAPSRYIRAMENLDPCLLVAGSSLVPEIRNPDVNDIDIFVSVRRGGSFGDRRTLIEFFQQILFMPIALTVNLSYLRTTGRPTLWTPSRGVSTGGYANDPDIIAFLRCNITNQKNLNIIFKEVDTYELNNVDERHGVIASLLKGFDLSILGRGFYTPLTHFSAPINYEIKTGEYLQTVSEGIVTASEESTADRREMYEHKLRDTRYQLEWKLV